MLNEKLFRLHRIEENDVVEVVVEKKHRREVEALKILME